MRKLLLVLLLISTHASAQWMRLGENEMEIAYVDTDNIQQGEHGTVKMWGLFDLKSPRNFGDLAYLSMTIQRDYSCNGKSLKSRTITRTAHAGNMGVGNLIYSSNTKDKWAAIQPDSVEEALWKIACKTKPD
jgi:hypothetical protein